MTSALERARARFEQSGDRGTAGAEVPFRDFLTEYLPRSLAVGHGEVIDADDHISKQTDLVIVDDHHPFTFKPSDPGLFFIEGVLAAGEVKADLTSQHLTDALQKSQRFKALVPRAAKGTQTFSNPTDLPRFVDRRAFFLFAFESRLTLETIGQRIVEYEKAHSDQPILDAAFVLDRGVVINLADGQGAQRYAEPGGEPLSGWLANPSDQVLFDTLAWLSINMPRFVRYQSILVEYI
jgi:hypothetical protein